MNVVGSVVLATTEDAGQAPTVSVVVPVHNGAASIEGLVARLLATLDGLGAAYEIVLVNDGSRDDSWPCIVGLSERHGAVRGIDLMRNYGQHNALLCGIRAARYDVVVTLDDDLQNPPEEIPRLLAALAEGRDVVYGTPRREQHGLLRDLASRITKLVLQGSIGAETARIMPEMLGRARNALVLGRWAVRNGLRYGLNDVIPDR